MINNSRYLSVCVTVKRKHSPEGKNTKPEIIVIQTVFYLKANNKISHSE